MNAWYMLAAIAGLGGSTLLTRSSFFVLPASVRLPAAAERALRYAPACALAAIIAPSVLVHDGSVAVNDRLVAAMLAAAVFARTRNMLVMMAVGMAAFTALRLL
jgi:branched-subunit amino acid transport protein